MEVSWLFELSTPGTILRDTKSVKLDYMLNEYQQSLEHNESDDLEPLQSIEKPLFSFKNCFLLEKSTHGLLLEFIPL